MSAGSIPSGDQIKDPGYPTASENYLTNSKGALSWLFTLDHKRIGVMYLIGVMTAFFAAGLLALLIRLHLFRPDGAVFTGPEANNWYNQVFTLHGAIMVFLFIIPSIPAALGNFLVPVMLGAKDCFKHLRGWAGKFFRQERTFPIRSPMRAYNSTPFCVCSTKSSLS